MPISGLGAAAIGAAQGINRMLRGQIQALAIKQQEQAQSAELAFRREELGQRQSQFEQQLQFHRDELRALGQRFADELAFKGEEGAANRAVTREGNMLDYLAAQMRTEESRIRLQQQREPDFNDLARVYASGITTKIKAIREDRGNYVRGQDFENQPLDVLIDEGQLNDESAAEIARLTKMLTLPNTNLAIDAYYKSRDMGPEARLVKAQIDAEIYGGKRKNIAQQLEAERDRWIARLNEAGVKDAEKVFEDLKSLYQADELFGLDVLTGPPE